MNGLTEVSFDVGEYAEIIDLFLPDTAYFDISVASGTSRNRAPGDIKPSWKWNSNLETDPSYSWRREYRQAISQVNWYTRQHGSRYGFILTEKELVVWRRLDNFGNLELADPIPFVRGGTTAQPQLQFCWRCELFICTPQNANR
ncbi:hypothetical protein BJX61DRAFT_532134 [Aspergillus egyptiacus]|nr:hypothetical protein BJX61DRAFT_532134 [Aspergillus egyptiacus]